MTKLKRTTTGLTKKKKEILRKYNGVYTGPIDLNKVRDEYKDGKNRFQFR